jgi:outer membrane receptor protein involved in Fe transport
MRKFRRGSVALAVALAISQGSHAADARKATDDLEEVVVTGVFVGTARSEAAIAVSTLDQEALDKLVPVSAADLLKNVPGVFVNSSLGEIRNVVFSRGVSANSLDGANGYFYVSLQEDGLPVTNVTFVNYGPDYLFRPDITLGRLEALRGGTSTVTGPNAPGGVFNYISRDGAKNSGMEVRARYGLEGNGSNPFYRADFYAGGESANGFSYGVGGFYRRSDGARYPGYAFNKGGQIKANLSWAYDGGKVSVYGKRLDDHNGWFEFLPAQNFSSPKLVTGISATDSFLPPSAPHPYTEDGGTTFGEWDGSNLAHSQVSSIGVKWDHEFAGGWSLANNLKYVDNKVDWNTGAVIFPVALDDFFNYILIGTFGPPGAGTYTFRDRQSGQVLASVQSFSGFDHTVLSNNLPNQAVLPNGVLTQAGLNQHPSAKEVMEQLSVTKRLDNQTFTLGTFFARSKISTHGGGAGLGLSPIANRPQLFDITLTTPGNVVQQVTDPTGFANIGGLIATNNSTATQKQFSLFFGHHWKFAGDWALDWGVRHETLRVRGTNATNAQGVPSNATGGLDGNPDTLFDNGAQAMAPGIAYSKNLNLTNYSAAISRKLGDQQSVYLRYSNGKKAPDMTFFQGLTSPFLISTQEPVAEHIQQLELGYQVSGDGFKFTASPFYSKLSNVGQNAVFTDDSGAAYFNPTLYSKIITYGVELEGQRRFSSAVALRGSLTLQDPKSKDFRTWLSNTPVRTDDTIASVPNGDADNNPKLFGSLSLDYAPTETLSGALTWRYVGKRAANRFNTFYLPGYHQVDLSANWAASDHLDVALNVNNVLNDNGVMSWAKAGSFLNALDRQAFTPADRSADPNQTFSIITIQPRAYFVTATYKF